MSYIALAQATTSQGATSVTFSNIPTSVNGVALRDLVIVIAGSTTGSVGVGLRFNGDTGSNYSYVLMDGYGSGSGSSFGSGADSTLNMGVVGNGQSNTIYQVFDYSATDKHKVALNRTNSNSWGGVRAGAGRWANTNAINIVQVRTVGVDTFNSGTTVNLFGIAG